MVELSANNDQVLLTQLEAIDISVPPINGGRTTEHCERWSICRLLATIQQATLLRFPIQLIKRERPDFCLQMIDAKVGIEITEGIQSDYARATVLPEADDPTSIIDPSLFKWGAPKKLLSDLRSIASETKLTGPGWDGNSMEVEWAQAILDVINRKTKKLQSKDFSKFGRNWLLIYDNLNSFALNLIESCNILVQNLRDYWSTDGFDSIFVESGDVIVEINNHAFRVLQINNVWKN